MRIMYRDLYDAAMGINVASTRPKRGSHREALRIKLLTSDTCLA